MQPADRQGHDSLTILILVNSMEKGGRTKVIAEEYQGLRQRGHNVELVTFNAPPDWVRQLYPQSGAWQVFNKAPGKLDFRLLWRLLGLIKSRHIQLVHAHCEASALYAGLLGLLSRVKTVATLHRSDLGFYGSGWKTRWYFGQIDRYVAVSSERGERMGQMPGIAPDRVHVIHWGVDAARMPVSGSQQQAREALHLPPTPIILSLGHLGPIKGHEDSIRALAIVRKCYPDVRLYIAGDGVPDDYSRLGKLIESLSLQDVVVLLGQVLNPLDWLQACDIFLQPSREEAFGLVFVEAGFCGVPAVATRVGGIPDIIRDGETGFLVPVDDPGAIADRLLQLLDSPPLRQSCGDAARKFVTEAFLLDNQLARLESLFRSMVR